MAGSMMICPCCHRTYDGSQSFCEKDGTRLTPQASLPPANDRSHSRRRLLSKQATVGILIISVLGGLLAFILLHRQAQVFRIHVTFEDLAGLKIGDPVYIQGADVGEVVNTRVDQKNFVATLAIRSDAVHFLRQQSMFFIGFDKIFLSRKCINVFVLDPDSPLLKNDQTLKGVDSWFEFYTEVFKRQGPTEAARIVAKVRDLIKEGVIDLKGDLSSEKKD